MSTPIQRSFFSTRITVKKKTPGAYDADGRWVDGAGTSTVTPRASVQPTSFQDRQALPEGLREKKAVTVFCESELRELDQATKREADLVVWEGNDYVVVSARHWTQMMPHWKAVCVRKEPEGS